MHSSFISGGKYTTDPSSYLETGYTATLDDGLYVVTSSSAKLVSGEGDEVNKGTGILKTLIVIIILGILGVLFYINRNKILELFKR